MRSEIFGISLFTLAATYLSVAIFVRPMRPPWRGTKIRTSAVSCAGFATVFWIPPLNHFFPLDGLAGVIFLIGFTLIVVGFFKAHPWREKA